MKNFEDTECENCGRDWGHHYDLLCYDRTNFNSEAGKFKPKGYELTDLCIHCGKELQDHCFRMHCEGDAEGYRCIFERITIQKLKLEDELFEI